MNFKEVAQISDACDKIYKDANDSYVSLMPSCSDPGKRHMDYIAFIQDSDLDSTEKDRLLRVVLAVENFVWQKSNSDAINNIMKLLGKVQGSLDYAALRSGMVRDVEINGKMVRLTLPPKVLEADMKDINEMLMSAQMSLWEARRLIQELEKLLNESKG